MIISEKWKYIFVGLPFSASSAISKELVEKYDGVPILAKHSNITDLLKQRKDVEGCFVFAVYRDPLEICFSTYTKFAENAHGAYTNPEYFVENGGWISKKARKVFRCVHEDGMDFESYIRLMYRLPYDSVFSLNRKHLDYVIDFADLNTSFQNCLREAGIEPARDLPLFNKTDNKQEYSLNRCLRGRVFGPFYSYNTGQSVEAPLHALFLYRVFQPLRKMVWKKRDVARRNRVAPDYRSLLDQTNGKP